MAVGIVLLSNDSHIVLLSNDSRSALIQWQS